MARPPAERIAATVASTCGGAIQRDDGGALGGEQQCARAADAAGRARHQSSLAL